MFGASFLTLIWIAWGVVTAVFVVLMIWKSVIGVPADSIAVFGAAQSQADRQHQASVLTRLSKCFGYVSLALLLINGGVWVYRGIVAVNGGRTP